MEIFSIEPHRKYCIRIQRICEKKNEISHYSSSEKIHRDIFLSLFNGISTFVGYQKPNSPLLKNSWGTIKPLIGGIAVKGMNSLIPLKVNEIARTEFELIYYDVTVQNVNHYMLYIDLRPGQAVKMGNAPV